MFEKDAVEQANKKYPVPRVSNELDFARNRKYEEGFKDGAEFGYNKAMKEWRDCFMSCSSPYCADKFRDIQCGGMLGNMTKEASDGCN